MTSFEGRDAAIIVAGLSKMNDAIVTWLNVVRIERE